MGKGGKVKRVLANRQSAQRSRIRKLQHISELEETLQGLQDDVYKLTPQLNKLQAKQAGQVLPLPSSAMLQSMQGSAMIMPLLGANMTLVVAASLSSSFSC